MDINDANTKVSPEMSGLPLRVESNDADNAKLKASEGEDSDDDDRDERRHKKKKKDRRRSRDRDDDRRRSKKDSRDSERSRSRDRHRGDKERDRSGERRDRDDRSRVEEKSYKSASKVEEVSTSDVDAKEKGVNDSDAKRDNSRDRRRDDRRADSRDRDRRGGRRSRSRSGDRRHRGGSNDRYSRRDEGRRDGRRDDRGSGRRGDSRDRGDNRRGGSSGRSDSSNKGGGSSSSGAAGATSTSASTAAGAAAESTGPKPVTLRDIMNANPGISMPEAVMRLNAYNTALAKGETPPPLSGAIAMSTGPAILPLGLAHLNPTTLGAVTSAAGVSLGEGGAATRPHREIYVGNIPPGITVPQLTEFLNGAMKQIGISKDGQNSVITAWVAPDGHFAFAEMRTIEEANAAMLHLNGVQCGQLPLRIGRPKGYNGTASAIPMLGGAGVNPLLSGFSGGLPIPGIPGLPSVANEPLSNAIMCSNLSVLIGEDMIRELFLPFGELKAFNVIKTLNGQTKSAVLEYVDPSVTDAVVQGMNKLEIADLKLSVTRIPQSSAKLLLTPAVQPAAPSPTNASGVAAAQAASSAAPTAATAAPATAPPARDPLADHPPSSVIRLSNMTTAEDLTSDENYNDLLEDVADECNTHGTVKSIIIPRGFDASRGQIFVHFVNVSDAQKCLQAVQGRKFNGKIVQGVYYPEQLFTTKVYVVPSDFVIGIRGGSRRQQVDMDTLD